MDLVDFAVKLAVIGAPLLAFPIALVWGLKRALWCVVSVVGLLVVLPPLGFGIAALFVGEPPVLTARTVFELVAPAILSIGGWMVLWSLVYGGLGAAIRFGWMRWRQPA